MSPRSIPNTWSNYTTIPSIKAGDIVLIIIYQTSWIPTNYESKLEYPISNKIETITQQSNHVYEFVATESGDYTLTLTPTSFQNLECMIKTNHKIAEHNLCITEIIPENTSILQGEILSINVTVSNIGDFIETSNVSAFYRI